jgi:prepilin peptidase dependent protein A
MCTDRSGGRRQRGDALIEALVGTVVAAVLGLGLSYTASRMVVSQRYVSTQYAVLDQMSNSLSSSGLTALCGGTTQASVTVGTTTLALPTPTCATAAITVSTPGVQSVTLPTGVVTTMAFSTPSASTSAQTLLGGNGVMTISQ